MDGPVGPCLGEGLSRRALSWCNAVDAEATHDLSNAEGWLWARTGWWSSRMRLGSSGSSWVTAQLAGQRVVAGRVLTFVVGKVSIEFSGEVKRTAEGGGGVKFWVVTADAKVGRSTGAAHKVTIELIPQTPEGKSFIVTEDTDTPPPSR
jgi:hypothetical protein